MQRNLCLNLFADLPAVQPVILKGTNYPQKAISPIYTRLPCEGSTASRNANAPIPHGLCLVNLGQCAHVQQANLALALRRRVEVSDEL